jgi:hypothetical protein
MINLKAGTMQAITSAWPGGSCLLVAVKLHAAHALDIPVKVQKE